MRSLTLSLLVVVLVAIFGMGWALDSLFARYSSGASNASDNTDQVSLSISLGGDIARTLNNMESPGLFVEHWQNPHFASASLVQLSEFPLPKSLAATLLAGEPLLLDSENGMSVNFYLPTHDLVFSLDNIDASNTSKWWIKAIFTSLFYLGTLAFVILWLKPLLLRLHRLRNAADAFGEGDLDSRVDTAGISYIADIEAKYNHMADQIQMLVEDNKLLTSAVSHDLRTPLARLRFGLDTLSDTKDPGVRASYQKRVSADLDEMESLVDSLLRYARLDNVMSDVKQEEVHLQTLAQECVTQFLDEAVAVTIRQDENLPASSSGASLSVWGSYEHLATMINNLLQNAVAHANASVTLHLHHDANGPGLSVHDDGPGIAADEREHLLKPFQRGSHSNHGGYGLGLAVVSRVAAHHGANLTVENSEELGGAKFTVLFENNR